MFSSLFAFALAGVALAGPLKRFDGLKVSVSGPSDVTTVDDLVFTASVTNAGSTDIKVLKYGTILDAQSPTKSFDVTKDGAEVAFTGIRMSVDLNEADDSAYVFIPAGETVSVEHDVTALFDFEAAGAGAYTFTPVDFFQIATTDALVKSIDATDLIVSAGNAVNVNVSGDVSKREMKAKRAVTSCSNASQASFISASYTEAKTLATRAANYISSNSTAAVYTSYFGTNSATSVRSKFTAVANENSSSRTLSCTDVYGACTSGVIAYTLIATTNIYFCSIFFNEVATSRLCSGTTVASRNVRGGTTLHELTHAVASTTDVTYGCSADQSLSAANKLRNADNYNCFSTQVYQTTGC